MVGDGSRAVRRRHAGRAFSNVRGGVLPVRVQTATLGGMKRRLMMLRIEVGPPPGKGGIWEVIASPEPNPNACASPPPGERWCDVVAGDVLTDRDGTPRTVLTVRIFRAYGGTDGDVIVSGRDWLRTGRVLVPGRPSTA